MLLFRLRSVVVVVGMVVAAASTFAARDAFPGGTMVPKIADDFGLRCTLGLPGPGPLLGRRGRFPPPPLLSLLLVFPLLLLLLLMLLVLLKMTFLVLARAAAAVNPMSTPEEFFHHAPRPRPG